MKPSDTNATEVTTPGGPEASISPPDPTLATPKVAATEGEGEQPGQAQPAQNLTAEEIAALRAQAAKATENWNLLLRATADFDNFKKRAAREKQDALRYANESLLQRLIPVLDTFDMALGAAAQAKESSASSLQTGVSMILSQLRNTLTEAGLEEIDAAGKPFDPNLHEAVSQQESADHPEGQVVQQLRKGYKLRERLLRPASVVVSKKPEKPLAP